MPVPRNASSASQLRGLSIATVPYGGRKKTSKQRNDATARAMPSPRPRRALPACTTMRYASATCASLSPRTNREQAGGHDAEHGEPRNPLAPMRAASDRARRGGHTSFSNRYPTPGSVTINLGRTGSVFDLTAHAANVHAKILLHVARRIAPHGVKELPVRERASRVLEQRAEQRPLGFRQVHGDVTLLERRLHRIDDEVADRDDLHRTGRRRQPRATKLRAHARLQLARTERLRDVVVGARRRGAPPFPDRSVAPRAR